MFLITWVFDKLGYMPKVDMQVGKVNIQTAWPFPVKETPKPQVKKKPAVKKVVAKKATKVIKKAK